jgi:D-beta-D-heptose 7-phosphate kinase/D-beta-D-heptose 1-phosphate adenosyltransferase
VKSLTKQKLVQILAAMQGKKILVIGDVMLDRYIMGTVSRISPEAPVPVVSVRAEKVALGGAANVANNIRSLGAEPLLVGIIGEDEAARVFLESVAALGIRTDHLVPDRTRPTTIKTRVVAHHQQVVRIDQEKSEDISAVTEKRVLGRIEKLMRTADAVLLEDYNKGLLTPLIIRETIGIAARQGKIVGVDPKVRNFFQFRGATLFKPNEKELLGALGGASAERIEDPDFLRKVRRKIGCRNLLITRGEKGMLLVPPNGDILSIPTVAREVFDVSGAGDTVISSATLALSVGATGREAAIIANYAAGVEVSKAGVAAITGDDILGSFDLYNGTVAS